MLPSQRGPRWTALLSLALLSASPLPAWAQAPAEGAQAAPLSPPPGAPVDAERAVSTPPALPAPSAARAAIDAPPAVPAPVAPAATAPASPASAEAAKDEPPKVSLTPGKGFTVTSADNRFSVTIRSRIQLRETFTHAVKEPGEDLNTNEINVKTLRFVTHGHLLVPELKFNIQLAFGGRDYDKDASAPESASPIFDAFLEYVKLRDLNVRVGQYFVPFDRARTIREFALQMVDRQIVVRELTLDRDVGLMLSSSDLFGLGGVLGYHLFIGGGEGRNRFGGAKMGPLVVARFVVKPMGNFDDDQEGDLARSPKPHLAIGLAGGYNDQTNRTSSTFGPVYTNAVFSYTHAAADLVFKGYGFSLLSEFVLRDADRNHRTSTAADGSALVEYSRSGYGYFVQAGQMVSDKVEVTARWDDLYAAKGTDPAWRDGTVNKQGRQAGIGLNTYLNGHALKLQTDYFYIFGQKNTDQPSHVVRAQIDASF